MDEASFKGLATRRIKKMDGPPERAVSMFLGEVPRRMAAAPCESPQRRRVRWLGRTISTQPVARQHSGHAA
jgi:hypothetical protein